MNSKLSPSPDKRFLSTPPRRRTPLWKAAGILVIVAGIGSGCGLPKHKPRSAQGAEVSDQPPFKTIVIEYKTRSRTVTETLRVAFESQGSGVKYLDIAGNRRREESKLTSYVFGEVTTKEALHVFDGKKLFVNGYGLNDEPVSIDMQQLIASRRFHPVAWADGWLDQKEVFRGEETFLGRSCKVYGGEDNKGWYKQWLWYGILLKSELKSDAIYSLEEAVQINEDVKIDEAKFLPPSGAIFTTRTAKTVGKYEADFWHSDLRRLN